MSRLPRSMTRLWTACTTALAASLLTGCGEEVLQKKLFCEVVDDAYATDQLSTYEILYGLGGTTGSDAVVMDSTRPANLGSEGRWHVDAVDVLIGRPLESIKNLPEQEGKPLKLAVEIWEGDDPTASGARHWELEQEIDPDDLDWTESKGDIYIKFVGEAMQPVATAVWTFDFSKLLANEDMTTDKLVVGVRWAQADRPLVAGSRYDKDCQLDWVRYTNQGNKFMHPSAEKCNLPMLQVRSRTIGGLVCE